MSVPIVVRYALGRTMDHSPILLAVVMGLHVLDSWALVRALGLRGQDRFWGIVLITFGQWGTLATVLSLVGALTPPGWLVGLAVVTALAAAIAWRRRAIVEGSRVPAPATRGRRWTPISVAGLAGAGLVMGAALVVQWRTPLHKGDDLMYHGSRAAYWLEHRGLLPYPTHNDRQNVVPVAAELPFLIALLFTRSERIARMVHLSALPLVLWGLHGLQRRLGLKGGAGLAGLLAFVTTPLVLASAEGIGAELWSAVGLLGFLYCLIRVVRDDGGGLGDKAWAGLGGFAALAVSFKLNLLPLLAVVPVALFARRTAGANTVRRTLTLAGGLAVGGVATGLALTLFGNTRMYGHPLGPAEMRRVHESDLSLRSVRVHAARVPFLLAGIPAIPSESAREVLEDVAERLADGMGATEPLRWERRPGWPGAFEPRVPRWDERFSLTGLCGAGAGAWVIGRAWRKRRRGRALVRWAPACVVVAVGACFLAIVFLVRWQSEAGVPDRFLVPLLAPSAALASLALRPPPRERWMRVALALALAWGCLPGARLLAQRARRVLEEDTHLPGRIGVFADAATVLPAGSRVLLVSNQNSGDYVLFGPEHGYSNVVIPWGQDPFDDVRLRDRLTRDRPTHVLVEDVDSVDFQWGGRLKTRTLVAAVSELPGARRIPLPDPRMRLFALGPGPATRDD